MSENDFRDYVVTENDELLQKLWAKWHAIPEDGGLDSRGMALFAYSLGLYPPGYEQGQWHTIGVVGLSDHGPEYLVWNVGFESPDATYMDQAREEADEDDDEFDDGAVWGELFPEGLHHVNDQDRRD